MIKVYVDDIRNAPNKDWVLVRTNNRAIRLLRTRPVEVISIDHDICFYDRPGKVIQETSETFMPIVYYLSVAPEEQVPSRIILHSANPQGRRDMYEVLRKYHDRITVSPAGLVEREDFFKAEYAT